MAITPLTLSERRAYQRTTLDFTTVLFDVDGTLVNSNGAHTLSWQQALAEHGKPVSIDAVRRLIGMGGDKLLPRLSGIEEKSSLGQAVIAPKKTLFAAHLPALEPTRGARALLEYLRNRGVKIVVATSAGDDEVAALLARAQVEDLFQTRASKDDAARSKPEPDIVHAALSRADANVDAAVMVGDTPYDIEAANRAGIPAIALRCGGFWTDLDFAKALAIRDDPFDLQNHWQVLVAQK